VRQLSQAKQLEAAGDLLQPVLVLSVLLGESPSSVLPYVQQQKLDGEEQSAIAFVQTMMGNSAAAQQSLQRYAAVHPQLAPRAIEIRQIYFDTVAAVQRGDGQTALNRLAGAPDTENPYPLFFRGRAHLLISDYADAETDFHAVLRVDRSLENGRVEARRLPVLEILSHFYLGQVYEHTAERDQAINEYQAFLSYFSNSHTRLAQVAEARSALKRLMQ
jgi:tetratricopeptide (TPR) repeat protein